MSEKKFDVPEEPSVTSADPNERKLARRLRIQRRLEALKKHEGSEDEGIVEKTRTERQIETSEELLEKLIAEGDEVVSNVRVANDAREVYRRDEDVSIRNSLLKKLEEEANESSIKYRAINEKWSNILASKDPLDIHAGIKSQNEKCLEILEQKDRIISELKKELENSDEKFTIDQKKQCEDINLLIERIDNQVNTIAKAYRRELVLIEEALNTERKTLLESVTKRWDALYEQRHEEDMIGVERRKEIMREYETEMRRVMIEHQEDYRAQKIELETECQNLQQEVERMKAVCMMNVEKLNYSYAVLKCREDENTIIKNQQKRRINKLQDVINGLRKSYTELEEGTRLEIQKLSEQVMKAHKNINELEAKSNHFTIVNEKQYFDIWDMNTRNANELVEKILTADKIIHEQTLGLDWEPPEQPLLKKEDLPSYRKGMAELQKVKTGVEAGKKIFEPHRAPTSLVDSNLERLLLNHILREISDHTGFLIEDRLRELLAPHSRDDNIIIRLDNVFQALSIKSEDQVDLLINFFLPYSYCPTCKVEDEICSVATVTERDEFSSEESAARNLPSGRSRDEEESRDKQTKQTGLEPRLPEICGIDNENSDENSISSNDDGTTQQRNNDSRVASAPERWSEETSLLPQRSVTCGKGHLLKIEAANVTKALKEFVDKCAASKPEKASSFNEKLTKEHVTLSRSLTNEDVTNYWKRYRDIFSKKKETLWDGLLIGLHKYHDILKERHKLNNETECLRKQNDELRRLLETYMIKPGKSLAPLGPRSLNKTA